MLLHALVDTSRQVAATPRRLAKIQRLAALLKQADPGEAAIVIAYLSGRLPQGRIGVAWASVDAVRADPAAAPSLTIADVDGTLTHMARLSGTGSNTARQRLLRELFARATALEQEFLGRLLVGELRQGALEGIMVEALAAARELPASDVRRAVMLAGDIGAVAQGDLSSFAVELFRPIKPMLAKTARDVDAALAELGGGPAALEWKFDGIRIQVHKRGADVRIYSRTLNDITGELPEVVKAVAGYRMPECILDGEAIALTTENRPLLFQETMKGLHGVVPFFFDIMYLGGSPLLDQPYSTRYQVLAAHVPEARRPPRLVSADRGELAAFFEASIAAGHEGLMAKGLDAPYQAGRRKGAWFKIKRAHTLDLVVLAAEWGHGRRQGLLSNLHLGARDPETGGFVMLGKTFKGMTDERLAWQTERLQEIETARHGHVVFVRPELVVEIAFNGLQQSRRYPGGLALRFARVIRYRDDKRPEDADTIETVRRLAG